MNGIVDQIKFCQKEGGGCKVVIGFETSAEDETCIDYARSTTSFVWGGGLPDGVRLSFWIENTLEPILVKLGIDLNNDLADPPFFIEHHASFMSYVANTKVAGRFPATNCTRATCTTCCPGQKHTKFCPKNLL